MTPGSRLAARLSRSTSATRSSPTLRRGRNKEVFDALRFCGATGSLSTEHGAPKWVRKALRISKPVKEYSTYVGVAETLSIVFHEVCVRWRATSPRPLHDQPQQTGPARYHAEQRSQPRSAPVG